LQLGIRPGLIRPAGADEPGLTVKVDKVEDLGDYELVTGHLGQHQIHVRLEQSEKIGSDGLRVVFPTENALLYADDKLVG